MGLVIAAMAAPALGDGVAVGNFAGRIVTGLGQEVGPPPEFPTRVFATTLAVSGDVAFDDNPGYFGPFGDGFAPGTTIGFDLLAAGRVWNGTDFFTISDQAIQISSPDGGSSVLVPGDDASTPGFELIADASADFDSHPFYTLLAPAQDGLYLIQMQLNGSGLVTSDPFWIVLNNARSSAELDEAVQWVRDTLVPAPGTPVLILIGAPLMIRRRRSRFDPARVPTRPRF